MSEDLDVESDVFLEGGVLYCVCGQPIEPEEAADLIEREGSREFVSCPTCDMRHFADDGKFQLDD
jgi:hypothetical protein